MSRHGSLNRVYRVVYNRTKGVWQAVAEIGRSQGKHSAGSRQKQPGLVKILSALARQLSPKALLGSLFLVSTSALAADLPQNGQVTHGQAKIQTDGQNMTINQSSDKAAINWDSFNIGKQNAVNFNQPDAGSVALNRVTGSDPSKIQGVLNANGQVFLVNPNGITFTQNAQVNVGGLVASTLDITTEDFLNGDYTFEGDSSNAIINQGNIQSTDGYVAMIAAQIDNAGQIDAHSGDVLMGAGQRVTLDLGGPVKIEVEKKALNAHIRNGGAIKADGGLVYLTAQAAGDLASTVINNDGIIEAQTLATGESGEIYLMGDMENDRIQVAGTLDASAPNGGDGGFVETSAAKVDIQPDLVVTTKAEKGQIGKWLIDPYDFTVAESGGDITGDDLSTALGSNSITIQTLTGTDDANNRYATETGNGDIFVNDTVSWDANTKLTLDAVNDIFINKSITANHADGQVALHYGDSGDYYINAPINLQAGTNFFTKQTSDGSEITWTVVNTKIDLQSISEIGSYVLGADINASETSGWSGGEGFQPIRGGSSSDFMGNITYSGFSGRLDGLGHTISNLTINRPTEDYVGLFGMTNGATIKNIGLVGVDIEGNYTVGGLVGEHDGDIKKSYVTGRVTGNNSYTGGLVGTITGGEITNTYSRANVYGDNYVGGLVASAGYNSGATIKNSYASGTVTASGSFPSGLVGNNSGYGSIVNSYYDKQKNTGTMDDSSLGKSKAEIRSLAKSNWDSPVWAADGSSFEGYSSDITLPQLLSFYTPSGDTLFEGGFGTETDAYTITDWNQLQNINFNSDTTTGGYYFALSNDLTTATNGYATQVKDGATLANSGAGWKPIGNGDFNNAFTGTFEGLDHMVSGLTINRPTESYIGLFGKATSTSINTTIKNIGLVDIDISGDFLVGGLVGSIVFSSITNAYVTGTVSGSGSVGGLVGKNETMSPIENSYASDITVNATGSSVGGLVGHNSGSSIKNSYVTGGTVNGSDFSIGGLVGFNQYDTYEIENSYVSDTTVGGSASSQNVGGLVGNNSGAIKNSYASATVSGDSVIGGLVGKPDFGTITNSYYDKTENPDMGDEAGYGKATADLKMLSFFSDSGWDIEGDSAIEPDYPFLAWQGEAESGYEKAWVIGTKVVASSTNSGTSDSGSSEPERIARVDAQRSASQPPTVEVLAPTQVPVMGQTGQSTTQIGGLRIVEISSDNTGSQGAGQPEGGDEAGAGNLATPGGNNNEAGMQAIFVVDGGIRLPDDVIAE